MKAIGYVRAFLISFILLTICTGFGSVFAQKEIVQQESDIEQEQAVTVNATTADQAWWRNLTQTQRNQAIVDSTAVDIGKTFQGLSCKDWVRAVIMRASRSVANIPQNLPNPSGWYWDSNQFVFNACYMNGIRVVKPGWAVQTNWRLSNGSITPHTFIVVSSTSTGMYIAECNWSAPNKVGLRWVDFSTFESQVPLYATYYITGG